MSDQQHPPVHRGPARRPDAPPPRPPVAVHLPPPAGRRPAPAPPATRALAWLWGAGCLAGAAALALAAADRVALRRTLASSARRADPGAAASVVDRGVGLTVGAAGAVTLVLLVVSAALLPALLRGGRRARRGLLVAGLLWVPVVAVDQSLVASGGAADRVAFLVQGALVVLALGALLLPAVRRSSGHADR